MKVSGWSIISNRITAMLKTRAGAGVPVLVRLHACEPIYGIRVPVVYPSGPFTAEQLRAVADEMERLARTIDPSALYDADPGDLLGCNVDSDNNLIKSTQVVDTK
jgi:hypothetical protein